MGEFEDLTPSQKRYLNEKACVVILNCELVGTWRNLKKLCDDMKEQDAEFFSYSSLSKKRGEINPIEFETEKGKYAVYIEKLK